MNSRMTSRTTSRGFTLVELLVVIAIISFLTSIMYANFAVARSKTVDSRKKTDLASMHTAIAAFNLDNQRPPHMYDCSGATCVVKDDRATAEVEDTSSPNDPQTESGKAFRATMDELVGGHYMPTIPQSPGGAGYSYYAYGSGSAAGAMVGTTMDTDPPTPVGQEGTCRPFPGAQQGNGSSQGGVSIANSFHIALLTTAAHAVAAAKVAVNTNETMPPQNGDTCVYYDPRCGNTYESVCTSDGSVPPPPANSCPDSGSGSTPQPGDTGGDGTTEINPTNTCNPKFPATCGATTCVDSNNQPVTCPATQPPNLCSKFSSKDYCLCTEY